VHVGSYRFNFLGDPRVLNGQHFNSILILAGRLFYCLTRRGVKKTFKESLAWLTELRNSD
jgi:hypothetical protein